MAELQRFGSSTEEDRAKLVEDAVPAATKRATEFWVRVFLEFCACRNLPPDGSSFQFEKASRTELASALEMFYADCRKKDGTEYTKNSIMAARGAIQRHLAKLGVRMNVFLDAEFAHANKVLNGVLKEKKRAGREPTVAHKELISDGDWFKLEQYFDNVLTTTDPRKLTSYVWLFVSAHFCLRGGEIQCRLKKEDLVFSTDPDGDERITLQKDFLSKNHQGGLTGSDFTTSGCIQDPKQVSAIKRYLSKLNPKMDRLFQRALGGGTTEMKEDAPTWFMNAPLSHNMLSSMMRRLSTEAGLSKAYTNHCVRATVIARMKRAGVDDRKICSVSGHKNVQSLQAYDRTTPEEAHFMSAAIDNRVMPAACKLGNWRSGSSAQSVSVESSPVAGPAMVLSAAGSTFTNVTFNVTPLSDQRRKPRFCLSLKRKRENAGALADAEDNAPEKRKNARADTGEENAAPEPKKE